MNLSAWGPEIRLVARIVRDRSAGRMRIGAWGAARKTAYDSKGCPEERAPWVGLWRGWERGGMGCARGETEPWGRVGTARAIRWGSNRGGVWLRLGCAKLPGAVSNGRRRCAREEAGISRVGTAYPGDSLRSGGTFHP